MARGYSGSFGSARWLNYPAYLENEHVNTNPGRRSVAERRVIGHTIAPVFRPTQRPSFIQSQIDWYIEHGRTPSKWHITHHEFLRSSFTTSSPVKYCPCCFVEQIVDGGFAYYKTEWNLPCSICCERHNCALQEISCPQCGSKPTKTHGFMRPQIRYCIQCGEDLWVEFYARPSYESSNPQRWFNKLLFLNLPSFHESLRFHCLTEAIHRSHTNTSVSYRIRLDADTLAELYNRQAKRIGSEVMHHLTREVRARRYSIMTRNLSRSLGLLHFWLPIIEGFQNFESFHRWLIKHSRVTLVPSDPPATSFVQQLVWNGDE